jgi:hypothetical protein
MDQPAPGLAEDCPCQLRTCAIWGNCVECVRVHRTNRHHLPECLQDALRECIVLLARQVELGVVDQRPVPAAPDSGQA